MRARSSAGLSSDARADSALGVLALVIATFDAD
jgi:hypothetical protein